MKTAVPRTIPAGQFKAKCLSLLDHVERTGRTLVVTKRGRPVARLAPLEETTPQSLVGSIKSQRDLISPIDEIWDADK